MLRYFTPSTASTSVSRLRYFLQARFITTMPSDMRSSEQEQQRQSLKDNVAHEEGLGPDARKSISSSPPPVQPATSIDHLRKEFRSFAASKKVLSEISAKTSETSLNNLSLDEMVPNMAPLEYDGRGRKVFFDVYGCQMNVSDTEIIWSILKGVGYEKTNILAEADVVLVVTCAIRDNAEKKVWNRLNEFKSMKMKRRRGEQPMRVAVLGCMAERLKADLLSADKMVDVVAGPDSYRDLPRLLSIAEGGQHAVNVQLSLTETYSDVSPIRISENSVSAFVTIMRGCDNMCAFCIVPFTRGRERSRPIETIEKEIRILSQQGVREVVLLGQNVNSFRDLSDDKQLYHGVNTLPDGKITTNLSKGFKTVYKQKSGGLRFAELLYRASQIDPEMRIRFTSPHPKDFPDELLYLIRDTPNICKSVHMPAQSGSTKVLESMRRGYTREAYIELADKIRSIIPNVSISSDFISGFCGETEEDHQDTLSLIKHVKYESAYLFAYSLREKTHAHRALKDDVPADVKHRRLTEVIAAHGENASIAHKRRVGQRQLVLLDSWKARHKGFAGRNDNNVIVNILPPDNTDLTAFYTSSNPELDRQSYQSLKVGDYAEVEILDHSSVTLRARLIQPTTLVDFTSKLLHN